MTTAGASGAMHGADALAPDAAGTLARLRTFHTLDALRGVAALIVLFFHAGFFFGIAPPAEGYLAVDLFFVMSGFVIAYRYEADLARGLSFGGFVAARLRRLYPLFLLGTVLGLLPALMALADGHMDRVHTATLAALPAALVMLPSHALSFARQDVYPLNFVSWSLALELLVNVAWAATFRVWGVRHLVWLLAGAALGLGVVAFTYGSLNVGYYWDNALGGLPRVVFGFGCGVLLFKLRDVRLPLPRVPWWALVAAVPAMLFVDPTWLGLAWARPILDVAFVTLVIPLVVRLAIASEPPVRARGACALAGLYSYVLYSLHIGYVGLFLRFEDGLHYDLKTMSLVRGIAFLAGLVALCWVAQVAYDKPVRRWLSHARMPLRHPALQASTDK